MSLEDLQKLGKTTGVHAGAQGKENLGLIVKTCHRKGILRYINTNKQTIHVSHLHAIFLAKAG